MPRCWHKNITLSTLVYMYYMVRVKTCKLLSRGPDNESIIPMIVSLSVPRGSTLLGVPYFPNTTILVFVLLLTSDYPLFGGSRPTQTPMNIMNLH